MTRAELNPQSQALIDTRLEAVDLILQQAKLSWSERRNIVGEVESQIYELLSRRSLHPGEKDVLAILASIDPPEAYIPEELRGQMETHPVEPAQPGPAHPGPAQPESQWQAFPTRIHDWAVQLAPGVAGVATLIVANGLAVIIIHASEGLIPWVVTLAGLGWLNYMGIRKYEEWSATRQGDLFNEMRYRVGKWLMPKAESHVS